MADRDVPRELRVMSPPLELTSTGAAVLMTKIWLKHRRLRLSIVPPLVLMPFTPSAALMFRLAGSGSEAEGRARRGDGAGEDGDIVSGDRHAHARAAAQHQQRDLHRRAGILRDAGGGAQRKRVVGRCPHW
jgi:hypothetical protein